MKKLCFLLLLILLLPITVFASEDITIDKIEIVDKSINTVVVEEPKIDGLKVTFNLKFVELNDFAKYKLYITNNSDDEYILDENSSISNDEKYISYKYDYEEELSTIKAGATKVLYVTVSYNKEIEATDYVDGKYENNAYIDLSLSKNNEVENPNTSAELILGAFLILICSVILILCGSKIKKYSMVLLIMTVLIPIIVSAIKEFKMELYINVQVEKQKEMGTFTLCYEGREFQFEKGMSFEEWMNSEYNTTGYEFHDDTIVGPSGFEIIFGDYPNYSYINKNDLIEEKFYGCKDIAECVAPDSKILIRENLSMYAKDIKENDIIMYFDFETNEMKRGYVKEVYVHKDATNFIKYSLEDGSYLEATDYHPIYTKDGWKSYTNRNGYEKPVIGDMVKTNGKYLKIIDIKVYTGKEDFYDFAVVDKNNNFVDNYYANGILVQSAYKKSR